VSGFQPGNDGNIIAIEALYSVLRLNWELHLNVSCDILKSIYTYGVALKLPEIPADGHSLNLKLFNTIAETAWLT